jgi:hypothetical protein
MVMAEDKIFSGNRLKPYLHNDRHWTMSFDLKDGRFCTLTPILAFVTTKKGALLPPLITDRAVVLP